MEVFWIAISILVHQKREEFAELLDVFAGDEMAVEVREVIANTFDTADLSVTP